MTKLKGLMYALAILIIGGYLITNLGLYLLQDYLLFFPKKLSSNSPAVVNNKAHEIIIKSDNVNLYGWFLNKSAAKLIIYYGGNGDELSYNIPDWKNIESYSVLMINYRGYGLSEGKPGESAIFRDALNVYDYITGELNIPPENIVLAGRSLGSGVAVYVAGKRDVARLILITPFDSIENIAKSQFPIFPVGLILKHKFDSLKYAKNVSVPALFIIAGNDRTIPNRHSINLANNWRGDYETIVIENADHNDIQTYPEYWQAITGYLNK